MRMSDMFNKLHLADKRGLMQYCQFLVMAEEQGGHWMRVPWKVFTFGWECTAKIS